MQVAARIAAARIGRVKIGPQCSAPMPGAPALPHVENGSLRAFVTAQPSPNHGARHLDGRGQVWVQGSGVLA
jgi:hypothetical protein